MLDLPKRQTLLKSESLSVECCEWALLEFVDLSESAVCAVDGSAPLLLSANPVWGFAVLLLVL